MIPDIILPNTKLRLRLPLSRLVQYQHVPTTGTGVVPEIYVGPTVESSKKDIYSKRDFLKQSIKVKTQSVNSK